MSELVFDKHAAVAAGISQMPTQPQCVALLLFVINHDAPPFSVDDAKFFILDGQDHQLQHLSHDEIRYSIQSWAAQNLRATNYPLPTPPAPQHNYVITGTARGNYSFTSSGNLGTLNGTATSTYTVQDQANAINGQLRQSGYMLGYTLGLALRQSADRKYNNRIIQQEEQSLAQLTSIYFKSQKPMIQGENRTGTILYWTGSALPAQGPFKAVLFLSDANGKQETVKFAFR